MGEKVKDPVCGMLIDESTAKASTEREGKKFYFCSTTCREEFERAPGKYLDKQRGSEER